MSRLTERNFGLTGGKMIYIGSAKTGIVTGYVPDPDAARGRRARTGAWSRVAILTAASLRVVGDQVK